jgi:transposase InsO family protein
MAEENPMWGYTRIQGALKNLEHRVGRSTIARILKRHGLPPVPARPTSWQTFLRAHWGAVAGADFFTTEVWTWRGLVTFYTVFVIDLASRRVLIVGSTPHPNGLVMRQVGRTLTATDGLLSDHRVLICDRDRKWSRGVQRLLAEAGVLLQQACMRPAVIRLHIVLSANADRSAWHNRSSLAPMIVARPWLGRCPL